MIKAIDRLIDTRQKRYSCFSIITMLLGIMIILPYLQLSYSLVTLTSYQDVFLLLEQNVIKQTYLSRLVVDCLSIVDFDLGTILTLLLENLSGWELITMILWVIFLSQKQTRRMRIALTSLLLSLLIGTGICAFVGFQATTLLEAVHMMKLIGIIAAVCGMILVLLCAYQLIFIHIPNYYDALHYQAEEC